MSTHPSPVRIAIVGAGIIGPRHAQSIINTSGASLACLVDPSPSADALAAELNVQRFHDIKDMLNSTLPPDAAVVCTPNSSHVSLSVDLLEAGIHVLVEKPLSVDIPTARHLVDCASKEGSPKLLVGHHRRFHPAILSTKQAIDAGTLGRVIAVNGLWMLYKPREYFAAPFDWRQGSGGGVVLINLIHEIDLLHYLLGPIIRVYAEPTISQRSHVAEEGAALTLRFASGAVGTFLICDAAPSPHSFEAGTGENPIIPKTGLDCYRIFGTEGSLSVPDMVFSSHDGSQGKSWSHKVNMVHLPHQEGIPFHLQMAHFVNVVRGEEIPRCSAAEGLQNMVVAECIRQAISTGNVVNVPQTVAQSKT